MHIHILGPSGAIAPDLIDRAAQRLTARGYRVTVAPHARGAYGRFAGTEEERIADLKNALSDPAIDAILCARGGYGLQQIIHRITPETVNGNREPKKPVFIGFSDITELHQWSGLQGRASLHGLMCKHLAEVPEDSEPVVRWHQALRGEPLAYTVPAHPLNRKGQVKGRLVGGNLSVLYGLQGTPYSLTRLLDAEPKVPTVLFIEDIAERHYHIDRMMQNLRMSGVMARISGLIVGQFSDSEDDPSMGCTIMETIRRAAEGYDYPVLMDFPAGHVERNLPLWLNSPCELMVDENGGTVVSVKKTDKDN